MVSADKLLSNMVPGQVYRRKDLAIWSNAVDRDLKRLVDAGQISKLAGGLYYIPKETAFGKAPPKDEALINTFLNGDKFLLTSPNDYNSLGVGTTQLYNKTVVYNHKRSGVYKLGNRLLTFKRAQRFPEKVTMEFLLVDLVNNVEDLAEDQDMILKKVRVKAGQMDANKLGYAVSNYGNGRTKKLLAPGKSAIK